MSYRMAQINELLLRELAKIVKAEFKNLWVTVTAVETAPNLRDAKVWISLFEPNQKKINQSAVLKKIQNYDYHFRQQLLHRLSLKYIPKLHFAIDQSVERAARIEQLLDQEKHLKHQRDSKK